MIFVVVISFTASQVEGLFFLQIFSDFSVEKFLRWESGKLTFLLKGRNTLELDLAEPEEAEAKGSLQDSGRSDLGSETFSQKTKQSTTLQHFLTFFI